MVLVECFSLVCDPRLFYVSNCHHLLVLFALSYDFLGSLGISRLYRFLVVGEWQEPPRLTWLKAGTQHESARRSHFSLCCVSPVSSTVRFRLWHSAKWRGGKYGGVILTPLVAPGCQVDHTLK